MSHSMAGAMKMKDRLTPEREQEIRHEAEQFGYLFYAATLTELLREIDALRAVLADRDRQAQEQGRASL